MIRSTTWSRPSRPSTPTRLGEALPCSIGQPWSSHVQDDGRSNARPHSRPDSSGRHRAVKERQGSGRPPSSTTPDRVSNGECMPACVDGVLQGIRPAGHEPEALSPLRRRAHHHQVPTHPPPLIPIMPCKQARVCRSRMARVRTGQMTVPATRALRDHRYEAAHLYRQLPPAAAAGG